MTAPPPILRLDGITKHFGGLTVIEDLTFAVPHGSRTGLIGPNGAGKTTVFNLITGVFPVDRGRIHLGGRTSPTSHRAAASAPVLLAASRTSG